MKASRAVLAQCVAYCIFFLIPASLSATPINTFVSVPVAKGGYEASVRYQFSHASNGPFSLDTNLVMPFFGYGITDRLAVLTGFPIVISDFKAPDGGPVPSSSDFGLADIPLYLRIQIFKKLWVAQNLGLSLLTGLEIPSGDDPFSSNSVDFPFGAIFTWQSTSQEVDIDTIYKINTEGGGARLGDDFNYDFSYTHRLLPIRLPDRGEPLIWNIVLEMNGHWQNQSSLSGGGGPLPDTGMHTLFFSPGFEFIFKNNDIQAGVQIPIFQHLNGFQMETKYNIVINWAYLGAFF